MKRRRTLVISLLLVAALCLGIGYAALSDTLDINGSADVNQSAAEEAFNEDIYFSAAVANQTGNTATLDPTDNDMASFAANTLKTKGDQVTFTFTIKNDGDLDALVTPSFASDGNTNPTYFKISSDWAGQARTIKAGQSDTYTVTVELLATPTETIHGSFHIALTATAG